MGIADSKNKERDRSRRSDSIFLPLLSFLLRRTFIILPLSLSFSLLLFLERTLKILYFFSTTEEKNRHHYPFEGGSLAKSRSFEMSTGDLLNIDPVELKFPFELRKQISCSLQLSNKTDNFVAFKVKTTNPKKYCVRPNTGIVLPQSTCDVMVTMQAQKEAPPDMQCRDKFLLQSVKVNDGATSKDITAEAFNKEAGHVVEECKLRVVYVSPPRPPSPVREGSEEGSSPRGFVSDNGHANAAEFATAARAFTEQLEAQDKSSEARALIAKLTEEKNNAIQQNKKLHQELELLRREGSKSVGGVSFMFVIFIGLLGIIMGYIMKKS
ncbi:vesicle-associated protein 1-2-like [Durio zibethinus]|uniref:Vesicle-associated protein 1-2-like n=1 Tax=Durio zibethinus TaxID=66656 RepID=A0A6P5WSS4_DURZI|nr:vesicle-associated protein 1-2-like [Durio zibethinus]